MECGRWVTPSQIGLKWVAGKGLTEGKDYEVLGIEKVSCRRGTSFVYTVMGDRGTKLHTHSSFFDEPESLPQRSTPCEEVGCDSFDDLFCVTPAFDDTRAYFILEKAACSQEQWQFLLSSLPTKERLCGDTEYLAASVVSRFNWFDATTYAPRIDVKVSFNDLFKYMGDV